MEVYQVNQMVVVDMERRVRQTASTMTALQAVTQAVLEEISNHGTLGWHCQHHQPSFAQKFSKPKSIIDELSAWSWEAPPPGA